MPRRQDVLLLLIPAILGAGCLGFRNRTPARSDPPATPEFRATAQNGQPMAITPPPMPKLDGGSQSDESPLHRLAARAAERERTLNAYYVRIKRHETINGKDEPEEIILFKFRRAPLSIHCKWLGKEANGREIVYVKGQHDDKIQVLTGHGDMLGAGRKMSFSPDSALVRSNLRHPLTEASLGAVAVRFTNLIDAVEHGQHNMGSARYLGEQNRPEFPGPVEAVEQTVPPGLEPSLMKGGIRFYYFDPVLNMPTLVVTFDHNRHQVEYYCFDRLQGPVNLDDADFDPALLWRR
ncbi:MAG: DUF1571 domain-containing protein [Gemmataceae bacterium]